MGRPDPWALVRPARPAETRTFTDPEQPGFEVPLTLRGMDAPRSMAAANLAVEYIARWITGERDPVTRQLSPPQPFPVPTADFELDESTLRAFAQIETMWAGPAEEKPEPAEMAGWQVMMPTGWFDILDWLAELNHPRGQEGNPTGEPTPTCSGESSPA